MDKTFSVKQAFSFAWEKFWSRWKFYVGVIVVAMAISWVVSVLAALFEDVMVVSALISIISIVVQVLISIGVITIFIKSARDESVAWSDLWTNKGRFLQFLGVSILYQIIVLVGLVVLIIPGIYLGIRYQYAQYAILDDRTSSIGAAFKRSAVITKDIKWRLVLLWLASVGVMLLGLLALGIGMLAAAPITALAQAFVYVYIRKTYHGDFQEGETVVDAEVAA